MAPLMAASAHRSLGICVFLSIFLVFGLSDPITFSRDALLTIRESSPDTFPVFHSNPEYFLELLVGGAAALYGTWRRRRRGKRAGALVKLRQRGHRAPLPSIHLANLRSLPNKMDELLLLRGSNKDFSHSAVLCFTETWLSGAVPDAGVHLPGFSLLRADRVTELSGKSKGGGICFYINEGWCTSATVLSTHCCPNLESLFIDCKPFYSPREFSSFILAGVYIPPQANVSEALQTLAGQLNGLEAKHPDSLFIVMGDFYRARLNQELPKYKQHISCPTRGSNTGPLLHCD